MKLNLLILGTLPPPIGGVTVHVSRLLRWLDHYGVRYLFHDINGNGLFYFFKKLVNSKVIHLHTSNPLFMVIITLMSKIMMNKVIVTIHGNLFRFGKINNFLVLSAIRLSDIPLLLNEESYSAALSLNSNSTLCSAYIPPTNKEVLQPDLVKNIKQYSIGKDAIIVTNAYDVSFDHKGCEIYGISELVKWVKNSNYLLIISDPSGNYSKWMKSSHPELRTNNAYYIPVQHSFVALLEYVDCFIRNTLTDGDSISIHEAQHSGVSVCATSCVSRPAGVFCYDNLSEIDSTVIQRSGRPQNLPDQGTIEGLIKLYRKMGTDCEPPK